MAKPKRKLTTREKAEKKRRKLEFMTIFIHGKQKRVKRPPTIDGMPEDEFLRLNADPIWLHQHGEWELIGAEEEEALDVVNSNLRAVFATYREEGEPMREPSLPGGETLSSLAPWENTPIQKTAPIAHQPIFNSRS